MSEQVSSLARTTRAQKPDPPFYIWVPSAVPPNAVVAIRGASMIELAKAAERFREATPRATAIEDWCDAERLEVLEHEHVKIGEQLLLLAQLARLYDEQGRPRRIPEANGA